MMSLSDRLNALALIDEAEAAGARRSRACAEVGIATRTARRWTASGEVGEDQRPHCVRTAPSNKLSALERAQVLAVCHDPEFASLPPGQIVPRLADRGLYLASESSFYRILHEADEQHHRGRSRAPRKHRLPTTYCAVAPCEVWSWDVSYLPSPVRGMFYYLYLIVDVYSRKIVGWEVHDRESGEYAATLVQRAVLAERCVNQPLVLHADNGAVQKGSTLRAKLEQLGIERSFSRPRVSDDNPYSESLFRTCKYRPDYPVDGFADLEAARQWMAYFAGWYNDVHRHSGIRHVTPVQRHRGEDIALLAARDRVYRSAKARWPQRWSGETRNWTPINKVWLNPDKEEREKNKILLKAA